MPVKRPKTQQELDKIKEKLSRVVRVTNVSKQRVPIQLRPPLDDSGKRIDFFIGERTIYLSPSESDNFPEDQLMSEQIKNLSKKGMIRVSKPR